jgi:hypothetical protein
MSALSTARRRLRHLAAAPAAGLLLVRAGAALALVDLDLRRGGVARALRAPGPTPPPAGAADAADAADAAALRRAGRYARSIAAAARHHPLPLDARCLHRALVLHRWLRRDGLPSELRVGVQKVNGALNAHAWVELGGAVVGDDPAALAAFAPLESLSPAPADAGGAAGGRVRGRR